MFILRTIKFVLKRILLYCSQWNKRIFNYLLPNIRHFRRGRIIMSDYPSFNQKTLITGLGKVKIGKVEIGEKCMFGYKPGGYFYNGVIELQSRNKMAKIKIGNHVLINNNLFICSANYVEIGNNVLIGEGVSIVDHEAHGIQPDERNKIGEIGTVIIDENVWIGSKVTILKNTKIGKNTIVAARAVVAGEFPADVIIGGVPAKIIRHI